jgi:hypothetical protein
MSPALDAAIARLAWARRDLMNAREYAKALARGPNDDEWIVGNRVRVAAEAAHDHAVQAVLLAWGDEVKP